jgi:hypothetical protein
MVTNETIEILKIIASFLTALIILIFGIIINRRLEQSKAALSKENDWRSWWAKKFLDVAHEYNSTVSECITSLFRLSQISGKKLPGWEEELKKQNVSISQCIYRIQYLDWEIQNYIQFTKKQRNNVLETHKNLFNLLENLTKEKKGNLEEIREAQFKFNESVRLAHAEMLTIAPNF